MIESFPVFPFDEVFHRIVRGKVELAIKSEKRAPGDQMEHEILPGIGIFHLQFVVEDQNPVVNLELIPQVKRTKLGVERVILCRLLRRKGFLAWLYRYLSQWHGDSWVTWQPTCGS